MTEIKNRKTKGRGGAGRGQGRPKKERPPDVSDKGFAARVLARVGNEDWQKMREAVELYRNPPAPPTDEKELKKYVAPAHPKTLVKSDEDLALYYTVCGDLGIEATQARALWEKRDGKAVHTVNHLHDKPIEMNHTLSLGEGMRVAMEKAEKRLGSKRN